VFVNVNVHLMIDVSFCNIDLSQINIVVSS
jgi:hypothetical protein